MAAPLTLLSDDDLLARVRGLVRQSNEAMAKLLCHLAEVDVRKLYAAAACSSLFTWCVTDLGFSEDAAYKRITVARLARRFPILLERLAQGRLHLTGICMLAPLLNEENASELIAATEGRSKREIEQLLADRRPKPDAPARVRKLPAPAPAATGDRIEPVPTSRNQADLFAKERKKSEEREKEPAIVSVSESAREPCAEAELAPGRVAQPSADDHPVQAPLLPPNARGRVEPLGSERYKVQFTASKAWVDKLREATALMSHRLPDGDMAEVLDQALTLLCEKLMKERFAVPPAPGPLFSAHRGESATAATDATAVTDATAAVGTSVVASAVVATALATPAVAAPAEVLSEEPPMETGESDNLPSMAIDEGWESSAARPSRYIPAAVRRQVIQRDGLRCTFVDAQGRRCEETRFLELHHCLPWSLSGPNTSDNLTLRCRCHNGYAAMLDFGDIRPETRHGLPAGPS